MNSYFRTVLLGAGLSLLAACGGGGGGGGNPPVVVAPDASIDPQNAVEIAGDVVTGVLDSGQLGAFGGSGLIGASDSGAPAMSKASASAAMKGIDAVMMAPFGPEVSQCAVAGTVSISGNLRSQDTLSPGDTITARFTNCDDGEGEVINGVLTLDIDTFEGDLLSGFVALGVTMGFQSFSVTEDGEIHMVNGGLSVLIDTRNYPLNTFTMSSGSLSVTDGVETVVLSNFTTTASSDESSQPPAFTFESSGRISVPRHGSVTYRVEEPFTGFGEGDPESGVLYIEGGGGASITATVLSATQVQLDMDYDGNGSTDQTVIVTWVELEG
jgi:hypothetical protein